jgi:hypothetical protein
VPVSEGFHQFPSVGPTVEVPVEWAFHQFRGFNTLSRGKGGIWGKSETTLGTLGALGDGHFYCRGTLGEPSETIYTSYWPPLRSALRRYVTGSAQMAGKSVMDQWNEGANRGPCLPSTKSDLAGEVAN